MSPVRQRNNVSVSRGKLRNLSVCPSVAYEVQTNEGMNDEAEDFYAILGVVSPKMVQVHLQCLKPLTSRQILLAYSLHPMTFHKTHAIYYCVLRFVSPSSDTVRRIAIVTCPTYLFLDFGAEPRRISEGY